jgi:hypothetical protein
MASLEKDEDGFYTPGIRCNSRLYIHSDSPSAQLHLQILLSNLPRQVN